MSTYEANRYNFSGANVTGIPTSAITSGTFADARFAASNITQHVDLTNLSASNLTSGTMPDARFPATLPSVSGANLTSMSVASTTGAWSVAVDGQGTVVGNNAKYIKVGRICHCSFAFYLTSAQTNGSDDFFYMTGLPFTAASSHSYAGGGFMNGPSQMSKAVIFVRSGTSTAQFQQSAKHPGVVLYTGSGVRRHSLYDGTGNNNWYLGSFTYATAS
tara:strand:+ start:4145 stop:4795 length:651 start_codon:yes stop_codon:yes gene_type:complete